MTVIQRVPYLLNPKSLDITAMPAVNEAQIGPAIGEAPSGKRNNEDKQALANIDAQAEALAPITAAPIVANSETTVPGLLPDCKYKASYNPHHDPNSIEHLMTHRIKLKSCRICQESKLMFSQHRQADNKAVFDKKHYQHHRRGATCGSICTDGCYRYRVFWPPAT